MHLPSHGRVRAFLAVAMACIATIALSSCVKAKPSASEILQEELLGRGFDQAIFLYDYANGNGYSFRVRVGNCSGSAEVLDGQLSVFLHGSTGRQTGLIDPTQADVISYAKSGHCTSSS